MNPKFKIGDIIGNIEIIDFAETRRTPCGGYKKYYKIKCKVCGIVKEMNTQTITNAKSCGCARLSQKEKSRFTRIP